MIGRPPLDDGRKRMAQFMAAQGDPLAHIAIQLDVSEKVVKRWLTARVLPRRKKKLIR